MKKIMVVDDDKDLLIAMKGVLKRAGYDVAITPSCEEGLELLASFKPHLIFMDINVGTEDGREMCKTIKSHAEYRHIPVILISANDEALKTYRECEADAVLRKPLQPQLLLDLAASHLVS